MESISDQYSMEFSPDDSIHVYTKTEDNYECLYEFCNGDYRWQQIYHYRKELEKVTAYLNDCRPELVWLFFEVFEVYNHPVVKYHYGAFVYLGFNVYEIHSIYNQDYQIEVPVGHPCFHYDNIPERIRAEKCLHDYLVLRRSIGMLEP